MHPNDISSLSESQHGSDAFYPQELTVGSACDYSLYGNSLLSNGSQFGGGSVGGASRRQLPAGFLGPRRSMQVRHPAPPAVHCSCPGAGGGWMREAHCRFTVDSTHATKQLH